MIKRFKKLTRSLIRILLWKIKQPKFDNLYSQKEKGKCPPEKLFNLDKYDYIFYNVRASYDFLLGCIFIVHNPHCAKRSFFHKKRGLANLKYLPSGFNICQTSQDIHDKAKELFLQNPKGKFAFLTNSFHINDAWYLMYSTGLGKENLDIFFLADGFNSSFFWTSLLTPSLKDFYRQKKNIRQSNKPFARIRYNSSWVDNKSVPILNDEKLPLMVLGVEQNHFALNTIGTGNIYANQEIYNHIRAIPRRYETSPYDLINTVLTKKERKEFYYLSLKDEEEIDKLFNSSSYIAYFVSTNTYIEDMKSCFTQAIEYYSSLGKELIWLYSTHPDADWNISSEIALKIPFNNPAESYLSKHKNKIKIFGGFINTILRGMDPSSINFLCWGRGGSTSKKEDVYLLQKEIQKHSHKDIPIFMPSHLR